MKSTRKLAAIMFTDIVGYTSLMGSDEDRAFEVLAKNREIHTKLITKLNGTLIKEMGDGMLISFELASDAVRCAIEIQKASKSHDIPLKIGIHEGEMVFEGNDVLGDGVNIASRLESDTPAGCISISGSVYHDIRNKVDIQTEFIEEKQFKNVHEKIKVFRVLCGGETEQRLSTNNNLENGKSKKPYYIVAGILLVSITLLVTWKFISFNQSPDLEKSIAVLPFKYLSGDESKQYLADGVMDAITGHLSKIDSLIVRPRTSVEQYRDTDKIMKVIGEELGVSYLIEGSFLLIENRVKVTIQLIDAKDDKHMFFEEYDRDYSDIIAVQSEVAQTIAKAIEVVISPKKKNAIEAKPTSNMTAYDYYLKGRDYLKRIHDKNDFTMAQMMNMEEEMYEKAVKLDSVFVLAWVGLAQVNSARYWITSHYWFHPKHFKYSKEEYLKDIQPQIQKTKSYLDKAIALAPDKMEVRREQANFYIHCQSDFQKAIKILEKLHIEYPKDDHILERLALASRHIGEYEKSLEYYRKAIALNSSENRRWRELAVAFRILRRYDEAEQYYEKSVLTDVSRDGFSWWLFGFYLERRKISEAKQYLAEYGKTSTITLLWAEGKFEEAIRELEKIPIDTTTATKGFGRYHNLGWRYFHIGQIEKATENYQRAKDIFEGLPYDSLKDYKMYGKYASVLAGLGMTTQALDTINKVIEVLNYMGEDKFAWHELQWEKTFIIAVKGKHDELFDQMEYILDRYGGWFLLERFKCSPSQIKCDPFWSRFEEFERFQGIINNPKYQAIPLEY